MARSKKKGKMILKTVIDNVSINKEIKVIVGSKLVPLDKPVIIDINFDPKNKDSIITIESIEVEYGLDLKNTNNLKNNKFSKKNKICKKNNN